VRRSLPIAHGVRGAQGNTGHLPPAVLIGRAVRRDFARKRHALKGAAPIALTVGQLSHGGSCACWVATPSRVSPPRRGRPRGSCLALRIPVAAHLPRHVDPERSRRCYIPARSAIDRRSMLAMAAQSSDRVGPASRRVSSQARNDGIDSLDEVPRRRFARAWSGLRTAASLGMTRRGRTSVPSP
jgi:hypothetical protein